MNVDELLNKTSGMIPGWKQLMSSAAHMVAPATVTAGKTAASTAAKRLGTMFKNVEHGGSFLKAHPAAFKDAQAKAVGKIKDNVATLAQTKKEVLGLVGAKRLGAPEPYTLGGKLREALTPSGRAAKKLRETQSAKIDDVMNKRMAVEYNSPKFTAIDSKNYDGHLPYA